MLEDEEIIKGCKQLKTEFLQAMYEKFADKMLGVCVRYTNREEAKDVLHESFLKVFTKISQYKGEGSLEGWVRKITVNTSLMYLRKKRKIVFNQIDTFDIEAPSLEENPDSLLEKFDFTEEELLNALTTLSENHKIVFNLYYIENYSHKEIADLLSINEITSRTRLNRARKLLQDHLIDITKQKNREQVSL